MAYPQGRRETPPNQAEKQRSASNRGVKSEFPATEHRWSGRGGVRRLPALLPGAAGTAELPPLLLSPPAATGRIASVFKPGASASPAPSAPHRGRYAGDLS